MPVKITGLLRLPIVIMVCLHKPLVLAISAAVTAVALGGSGFRRAGGIRRVGLRVATAGRSWEWDSRRLRRKFLRYHNSVIASRWRGCFGRAVAASVWIDPDAPVARRLDRCRR